jgi:hypothetical protein
MRLMRQVLVFALIAFLLVAPVIVVLVVVAGLAANDTPVARVACQSPAAVQSVALQALPLLRAPPA